MPDLYTSYYSPTTLAEALALKADLRGHARIVAGGTDLLLEIERGVRKGPDGNGLALIDLTRVPGLAEISEGDGRIHLGPLVTHNQAAASSLIVHSAFPLARACWEVGAPQIRNRATVAGNVITASPANDSIVPLLALGADVTLTSTESGERSLPLADFMTGFRQVDMADDEILTGISLRALTEHQRGSFLKLGLRRAQAISVVSVAGALTFADRSQTVVTSARIALGAVTPVVTRAAEAETFLAGKPLTDETIAEAARLAVKAASPIDDIRATGEYRRAMVEALTARLLHQLRDGR
ncbi:MAG: FAD binding domain-containing protein, partial [Caldilineaceae bacterium]